MKSFPVGVRDSVGYALYLAQQGGMSTSEKPLHGFGSGVMEIRAQDPSGSDRVVYTVSIGESMYVVHAFQKKSKSGIATPKMELALLEQRLKQLRKDLENAQR